MGNFDAKYLKAAVYGANDGIVTTFAVVAGVMGAELSVRIVLILGLANMIADGISMAAGDYLGERSEQRLRARRKEDFKDSGLWKTGLVTFVSFVSAGSLPLIPYVASLFGMNQFSNHKFLYSIMATAVALFFVGSMRTLLTKGSWIRNGLEMLIVGAAAAGISYLVGMWVEQLLMH